MPKRSNEVWSLDFVHDQLSGGTKFRALTVVDVFSRGGLAIEVGRRDYNESRPHIALGQRTPQECRLLVGSSLPGKAPAAVEG